MKKTRIGAFILSAAMLAGVAAPVYASENAYAVLLNEAAAVKSDSVAVEITTPVSGSVVHSAYNLTIEADAESTSGITSVEFYKDSETTPFATDSQAPYSAVLTAGKKDFTVTAKAYSQDGLYNEDTTSVTVDTSYGRNEITYLDADFESGSVPANINLDKKGETAAIVDAPEDYEGNKRTSKVAYIKNVNGKGAPWANYLNADSTPLQGEIVLDMSFMSDQDWDGANHQWLMVYGADSKQIAQLMEFNGTKLISRYDNGTGSITRTSAITSSLVKNKWYDMKFYINMDELTYDLEFEGEMALTGLKLPASTTDAQKANWKGVTKIENRCTGSVGDGMYIDWWKIYTKPYVKEQKTYTDTDFSGTSLPADFAKGSDGNADAVVAIKARPDDSSNTALYIGTTASKTAPYVRYQNKNNPMEGTVIIEADVIFQNTEYPKTVELFYMVDNNGNIARFAKAEGSDINLWTGKSRLERAVKGFSVNTPYHFSYTIDTDAMTYDVTVTGGGKTYTKTGVTIVPEHGNTNLDGLHTLQFRLAGNDDTTEDGIYVDNVKIYGLVGPEATGAVFNSDSGVLSVNRDKAPYDLRNITVTFDSAMNKDTFGGVTLKTAAGATVEFTGEYLSDTKQYVVTPKAQLQPKTAYVLDVPASVKGADGSALGAFKMNFTTTPLELEINSKNISNENGTVTATVNVTNNKEAARTITAILVFRSGDTLIKAVPVTETIPQGEPKDIIIPATEMGSDISGYTTEVYLWNDMVDLWPICEPLTF